jgi:uncharacterized RDD family membrane protein YckC
MVSKTRGLQGQYAGFISRAIALILDQLIVVAAITIFNGVIAGTLNLFLNIDVSNCPAVDRSDLFSLALICQAANWLRLIISLVLTPVYFGIFWTLGGQTVGQYALGLRVVRLDGRRMTLWRSLLRWAGYLVSLIAFGLGFLWVLWDDRRQGWADKLARTVVVYAWQAQHNEFLLDRIRARMRRRRRIAALAAAPGDATAPPVRLELVMTVFASMNQVQATMNILQDAILQRKLAIINTVVFVKDETGAFGYVGASDLTVGDAGDARWTLLVSDPRLRGIRPEELTADVPNGSFILLIFVEDAQLTPLLKTLTAAKLASQVFDLDRPAHTPVNVASDAAELDALQSSLNPTPEQLEHDEPATLGALMEEAAALASD